MEHNYDSRALTKIVRNKNLYKNKVNNTANGKYSLNETAFEIVRYLTKKETLPLSDLVEYLNVNKALVTRLTQDLESQGYLTILPDSSDKRKKILKVTPLAYEAKDKEWALEHTFYEQCLSVLTPTEYDTFMRLLDKVYKESKRLRKTSFQDLVHEE